MVNRLLRFDLRQQAYNKEITTMKEIAINNDYKIILVDVTLITTI